MIPADFVQTLLSRVDIVDVIEPYVPLKRAGTNLVARCPFHTEKSPSFNVSPTKQFFHCFGCGENGDAISFLMKHVGMSFRDAVEDLAGRVGMTVPAALEGVPAIPAPPPRAREALHRAAKFYRDQLRVSETAIEYLKRRGLSGEIARQFGLGYAPGSWQGLAAVFPDYDAPELAEAGLVIDGESGRRYDRFRDRIMFPVLDARNEIIGFGGRVMGQGEPKYLNSPETPLFQKGRELYGLTQARKAIQTRGRVLVVEGYMDVIGLAQFGVGYAVATLGTATTPYHAQKLMRLSDEVVFCFDGDAAGRRAAWKALENALPVIDDGKSARFLFLPEKEDPDSFVRTAGADAFERLVDAAVPLSAYLIGELAGPGALDSAEGRARLVHRAKPLLAQVKAPTLRVLLRDEVARVAGVEPGELGVGNAPAPVRKRVAASSPRQVPSLERRLLACLLVQTDLAGRSEFDECLERSPADSTLRALVEWLRVAPSEGGVSAGGVLQHFRGSPHEPALRQAAADSLGLLAGFTAEELERELSDGVERLLRERREDHARSIVAGSAHAGMTDAQRRDYLAWLAERRAESGD